jgi:hypothetical protein
MSDRKTEIQKRIKELDICLEEQKKRIPPHSVQPEQIMELERLEDEREALQKELDSL